MAYPAVDDEPVPGTAVCDLDHHPYGEHMAMVRDLDTGGGEGAAWARWEDGHPPRLDVLPYCPSTTPSGSDACWLFEKHRGGHTWEHYL
ncbi:hypothetical protein QIS99_09870 [Streptomyces sp. B-S-A8]|uniref:Uncharacterized protein n=1 Tax=Streptomyces solicavernae TaxID=3043614 RepID=A0ABT6RPZ8_9ACTN|nr:hypothetical protein [Streptomyces sp. B-S-A8]MDI3386517.1 hypothetical protein [Streptomyces sp. B-S-A8]